ncbi:MAG: hypothetical protein AB1410_03130 [Acidobacteriota bacterium]
MNLKRFLFITLFLILLNSASLVAQQNIIKFSQKITPKFSIKLFGGMGYILKGGDLKEWFRSETEYFNWLNGQPNYKAQSDYQFTHTTPEINLEASINLIPRFSLGIGIGYLAKSWKQSSSVTYDYKDTLGTDTLNHSIEIKSNIIPLTLTGNFLIPVRNILDINVMAGAGYYISTFKFADEGSHSWPNSPGRQDYKYTSSSTLEAKSGKLGFHFGGGTEIKLFSNISLTIDALYRLVKFDEIKGETKWKESIIWTDHSEQYSGTTKDQALWYGTYRLNGNIYHRAIFNETEPSWLENVRPFEFKLDSLIWRIGIKVGF